MAPAIQITELSKNYPGAFTRALDGLSLEVKRGSIFGLLGPNGAGKTTTINILCGLIQPDSGKASIFGMDAIKQADAIRRVIGVVPQHIALYPLLSGAENLHYIGQLYGLSKPIIKQRSADLMER